MKVKCVKLAPGADMNKHTNTTTPINRFESISTLLKPNPPFPTFVQSQLGHFINQMRSVMTLAKCKTSVIPRTLIKRSSKMFFQFLPNSHQLSCGNGIPIPNCLKYVRHITSGYPRVRPGTLLMLPSLATSTH